MTSDWAQLGGGGVVVPPPQMLLPLTRGGLFVPFGASPLNPALIMPPMNKSQTSGYIPGEGPQQMRKLFIGGLTHDTTDDQLRQYFSKWGPVIDAIVIRDPHTKHSRGFGFVTFGTLAAAEAAINDRPHHVGGKAVDSKRAIPREQMMPFFQSPEFAPDFNLGCKLTITGIHCDFHNVEELRVYFEKFGPLVQVEIMGKPRGVGFVIFEYKADADRCLAYKAGRHIVNNKRVEVRPAPPSHYRQSWKRRAVPPLLPFYDQFAALSMQHSISGPFPLMAHPLYPLGASYSEEDSSYGGCTTEDESKNFEESSERDSTSGNSAGDGEGTTPSKTSSS